MLEKALPYLALLLTMAWLICISPVLTDEAFAADKIPLKVATVCMNASEDKEANMQKFFAYMEEAFVKGAHLIVFPEIALQQNPGWGTSAYRPIQEELDYVRDTAETIPGDSTEVLVDKARELGIYVVFGMTEYSPDDGKLYNSSVFLGPDGVIGKYRKSNLWDASTGGNENLSWERGKEIVVLDSPIGKVGLIICIDMYYFVGDRVAKEGAELIATASAWPASSGGLYEDRSRQNALRNHLWHIVSNQVGTVGHAVDYGHSRIIDPKGNIIVDTGQKEGMVIAETDLLIDPPVVSIPPMEHTVAVGASQAISTMWGEMKQ